MKKMEVVMTSSALDTFKESATRLGVSEYDVSDVRLSPSFAVKERRRLYRGNEYTLDLIARVKVEFAVLDEDAKQVAQNILTLITPDRMAIYQLDEVIGTSPSVGQKVPRSRPERDFSEVPSITHH